MSIQLGSLIIALPPVMAVTYWIMLALVLFGTLLVSSYQLYHRLANSSIGKKSVLLSLNTLAFVALAGLIIEVKIGTVKIHSGTLITPNVSAEELATMAELADEDTLWYLAENLVAQNALADKQPNMGSPADSLTYLDSVAQIAQLRPDLQQLNVIGDGLTATQWQQLFASHGNWGTAKASKLGISFNPSPKLSGPINLSWRKQLVLGEPLTITGELQTALPPAGKIGLYRLTLVDPTGETVEQHILSSREHFSFNVTPKTLGTWLYQLKLFTQETDKPLAIETVAVQVNFPPPQAIAIWQSAPSFETRQFKDWAANFGNPVTIISQISRDKFISEQLNTAPDIITQKQNDTLTSGLFFTAQHLQTYDLLLIDGRGLVALNNNERTQLAEAVNQGLGVLILADGELLRAKDGVLTFLTEAIIVTPSGEARVPAALYWQQTRHTQPISWLPGELATTTGAVLVENEMHQAIVASAPQGMGQVAVSLVNTSYAWHTAGHASLYSQYWQYLLKHIARNRSTNYWLTEPDNWVTYSGQTQQICVQSASPQYLPAGNNPLQASHSQIGVDGQPLPLMLQTSQSNDTHQCAYYWVMQSGWQRFLMTSTKDATPIKVDEQARYVYPPSTWRAWQQSRAQQVSAQVAKYAVKAQPKLSYSPVPKGYFFFSLVFILTLLWVARKRL
ncbi:MAG: hypothetical protein ACJA13_001272 [Paraglaciecola sp.]|jgi:hypothetical protein